MYKKDNEKVDHGIVGACTLFRRDCQEIKRQSDNGLLPSIVQMEVEKIACYNIASHNIYKSSCKEFDRIYSQYGLDNLLSTSKTRVNKKNGLLMLLSLVDTIECYKLFPRRIGKYDSLYHYTILDNIDMSFNNNSIKIDFSKLFDYIKKNKTKTISKKMIKKLSNHIDNICSIDKWTDYKSKYVDDRKMSVEIIY